jgi:hypothetical protein
VADAQYVTARLGADPGAQTATAGRDAGAGHLATYHAGADSHAALEPRDLRDAHDRVRRKRDLAALEGRARALRASTSRQKASTRAFHSSGISWNG